MRPLLVCVWSGSVPAPVKCVILCEKQRFPSPLPPDSALWTVHHAGWRRLAAAQVPPALGPFAQRRASLKPQACLRERRAFPGRNRTRAPPHATHTLHDAANSQTSQRKEVYQNFSKLYLTTGYPGLSLALSGLCAEGLSTATECSK